MTVSDPFAKLRAIVEAYGRTMPDRRTEADLALMLIAPELIAVAEGAVEVGLCDCQENESCGRCGSIVALLTKLASDVE